MEVRMKRDRIGELAQSVGIPDTGALRWFAQKLKEEIVAEANDVRTLYASPGLDSKYKTPHGALDTLIDRISRI